jgi:hypothetical protein
MSPGYYQIVAKGFTVPRAFIAIQPRLQSMSYHVQISTI